MTAASGKQAVTCIGLGKCTERDAACEGKGRPVTVVWPVVIASRRYRIARY